MESNATTKNPLEPHPTQQIPQQPHNLPKIKPIVNPSPNWKCKTPSDIARIIKCKSKANSSVSITGLRSENIGTFRFQNLLRALIDTKRTTKASFQISGFNTRQLSQIVNMTNHWRNLKFLTFPIENSLNLKVLQSLGKLRRCKNLSVDPFPIDVTDQQINRKIIDRVIMQLKGLNKLEYLHLRIPFYGDTDILKSRPSRSLKSIILYLENKESIEPHQLSKFFSKVKHRCNQLESLGLNFPSQYNIESSDAQVWNSFFQNPSIQLKRLALKIKIHDQQQPEGLHSLIESLKHLKTLNAFALSISPSLTENHPLTTSSSFDRLVSSLFTSLQPLTLLEELKIELKSFGKIKYTSFTPFASMLQSLKSLKSLTVHLPPLETPLLDISDLSEYFSALSRGFKDLPHLKILDFEISNNANPKSIEILSNSLAPLNLTSISLAIGYSTWTFIPSVSSIKSGLGRLFGTSKNDHDAFPLDISRFSSLSELKLDLFIMDIPKLDFRNLALQLRNLKNFSSLSLILCLLPPKNMANNYEGLANFFPCLKDLPKLIYLKLHFLATISDEDVNSFASNLVECQDLKEFNLRAEGAKLTDQSLYFLLTGLRGLLRLESLELILTRERIFENDAILDLLEGLVVLKKLKKFIFAVNARSWLRCNYAPLPEDLKGYLNLNDLVNFIVYDSRYI